MPSDLRRYMVRLAVEPEEFCRFVADPHGAAEKAGLSKEERDVLLSGDQNRMYAELVTDRLTDQASES